MHAPQNLMPVRALACAAILLSSPLALAQSLDYLSVTPASYDPGVLTPYTVEFRADAGTPAVASGISVRVDFPDEAQFDSFIYPTSYGTREGPGTGPFPAYTLLNWPGGGFTGISNVLQASLNGAQSNTPGSTWYRFTFVNLVNPATAGTYPVTVELRSGSGIIGTATFDLAIGQRPVDLGATPAMPRLYAEEIRASAASPVTLAANDALGMSAALDYSFSVGEVRYARLECDQGLRFGPDATVSYVGGGNAGLGAINGLGGSAITFSVTANDNAVTADDRLLIGGSRIITGTEDVTCTYGLYDFPSQAQAGGSAGRVAMVSGPYLRFAPSYALAVTEQGAAVADVESAEPAYSAFVAQAATGDDMLANLGRIDYGDVRDVEGSVLPLAPSGLPVTLADLIGANTALVFEGDFGGAGEVFLSPVPSCGIRETLADAFDDTHAVFVVGSQAQDGRFLCYEAGGAPIPASGFTVSLEAESADPARWNVTDRGPLDLGVITRNGTELQAPFVQVPDEFVSRIALTNTGPLERAYTISAFGEEGNVISTANLTGTIPARGTRVIYVDDVLTGFTGPERATLNVTVAAPNDQIQGLYQIVNPDSGTISNHVMVRPFETVAPPPPLPTLH